MATVIDAFITTLGLDGTKFRKGMADAEKSRKALDDASKRADGEREKRERAAAEAQRKRQAQHDARVKSTVAGYQLIRNQLLALTAIFTAGVGIKDFVSNTITSAANLGYLSANLKMSTESLTSWQRASERAGGSANGIIAQLKESQDTLAQLKSGMGPNEGMQNFFRWGGTPDDIKDGNSYLLARSRIIHNMFTVDPAQAALVAKSMGVSEDQFDFLKQGPDAVLALVRAQEKNAAITAKDAQAALELKNKMLDLRDSLQSTATRIILQLAPTIERLLGKLEKASEWVADHKDDIAKWVEKSIAAVTKFATKADEFANAIGGWKNILLGLGGGGVTVALAGVAAGIAAIVSAGLGIPALVAALGVLIFYGGYKGGEYLFGAKPDVKGDALRKQNAGVMGSGKGSGKIALKSKSELKAEAERQWSAAGLAPRVSISSSGGSSPADAIERLTSMGWSTEQAAGIVGSFMQESGLDPAARNPTSGAYGIGQWLGSRVGDFKKFAGRDLVGSSIEEQLAFFNYETGIGKEQRAGKMLRGATTAEDAARIHSEMYERPGSAEANVERRQRMASQLAAAARVANAMRAGGMPMGAGASLPGAGGRVGMNTTSVNIERLEVNTQATDAPGIASSLRPALEKYTFPTQANSGMQ